MGPKGILVAGSEIASLTTACNVRLIHGIIPGYLQLLVSSF